ncbi:hypothetical protein NL676_023036 [Syzygium grande]|nr:hypothetical protein NL676_023036 [Syzygium grande]
MGICHSSEPASAADATAKLILHDGRLREFAHPVRASRLLQSCCGGGGGGDPACFICDADDVGPDGAVSAVGGDEELRFGRLYFALPLSRLERPLEAKEMAALAVKASSAMKGGKGRGRKCRGMVAGAFSVEKEGGGARWRRAVVAAAAAMAAASLRSLAHRPAFLMEKKLFPKDGFGFVWSGEGLRSERASDELFSSGWVPPVLCCS